MDNKTDAREDFFTDGLYLAADAKHARAAERYLILLKKMLERPSSFGEKISTYRGLISFGNSCFGNDWTQEMLISEVMMRVQEDLPRILSSMGPVAQSEDVSGINPDAIAIRWDLISKAIEKDLALFAQAVEHHTQGALR